MARRVHHLSGMVLATAVTLMTLGYGKVAFAAQRGGALQSQRIDANGLTLGLTNGRQYAVAQQTIRNYFNSVPGTVEQKRQATAAQIESLIETFLEEEQTMLVTIGNDGTLIDVYYEYR